MPDELISSPATTSGARTPPYSEEAERGVLGSILLDAMTVMDLCLERQLEDDSFYVPAHKLIFECLRGMSEDNMVVDSLTLGERLTSSGQMDRIGGSVFLDHLIDSTPTAAHAEYYIDIVRQKHLLRSVLSAARSAENECYTSPESADLILSKVEQSFMEITEHQHGYMVAWPVAIKGTMEHIENVFNGKALLSGVPSGYDNFDAKSQGLRQGEMIVLAARPSMGKTSLAMNIAENIALGNTSDKTARPVGIFSLEMSQESLVMRMLCSHAGVSSFKLARGYVSQNVHARLTQAASALTKAPMYLDDTGGLDITELRARARRMKKKYDIQVIVIDYLQLLHSKEFSRQGKQIETAFISGNIKAMAKELKVPVLVLSQLSRAPEQRDKLGKPKLSDLRDSGAIEQDADVVCMLRRPCRYPDDDEASDKTLAVVDFVKQRNGPTGEVRLNFEEDFTRFKDRAHGVDGIVGADEGIGGVADGIQIQEDEDAGYE